MDHLLHRYGSAVGELIDLVDADPELREPLQSAPRTSAPRSSTQLRTRARCTWTTSSCPAHPAHLRAGDHGVDSAEEIADLVAPVLGWDTAAEIDEVRTTGPGTPPNGSQEAGRSHRGCGSPRRAGRPSRRQRSSSLKGCAQPVSRGLIHPAGARMLRREKGSRLLSNGQIFVPEILGTGMLMLLGCGVVANVILAGTKAIRRRLAPHQLRMGPRRLRRCVRRLQVGGPPQPRRDDRPARSAVRTSSRQAWPSRSGNAWSTSAPRWSARSSARCSPSSPTRSTSTRTDARHQARRLLHRPGHPLLRRGTSSPRSSPPSCWSS